jgi:hypothetical protein
MKLTYTLNISLLAAGLAFGLGHAFAEDKTDCAVTYTRTACTGQEAESFKKCDGKKSCTKYVAADSEASCSTAAVDACSNDRPTVTQSKVITATYKGKPVKSKAGKPDMCLDYAKRDAEFNQCTKK